MGQKLETVKIKHVGETGFISINLIDYNPDLHELYNPADPKETADKPEVKPTPLKDDTAGKTDLNSAPLADLMALDGIGGAKANKLIDNRPYKSIRDVWDKTGLNLEKLQSSIFFS
jgi:DNA uptake protein ComE-like DNA-binding protein